MSQGLTSLTYLDIGVEDDCSLDMTPESLSGLHSLHLLAIRHVELWPHVWGKIRVPSSLALLKDLTLRNTAISAFSAGHNLTGLTRLILDDNQLCFMPSGLKHLQSLQTLSLDRNSFMTLPAEVQKLMSLTVLSIEDQHTKTFQLFADLLLSSLPKLQMLRLQQRPYFRHTNPLSASAPWSVHSKSIISRAEVFAQKKFRGLTLLTQHNIRPVESGAL